MRNLAFLLLLILLSITAISQDQKTNFGKTAKPDQTQKIKIGDEKEEFRKAINQISPENRVAALLKFIKNFPESGQKDRALGLITSGRAELADDKLRVGETEEGIKLFKLAVEEAPIPISDQLYTGIILQIPNNLFWRGQRPAAFEIAKLIEEKVSDNPTQMLALATFHIGVENGSGAIRLAEKAIKLKPDLRVAYQTLGLAHRINFDLGNSAEAYAKALEFDTSSATALRNLAEMRRATGKTAEAIALYQRILEKDVSGYNDQEEKNNADINARTGLILSMFDAGKVVEAELQLNKSLEANPNNLILLVGAAYWYAANGDGDKAIELSQRALSVEPRYTWSYIALARGLMKKGDPLAAERTLLAARQFGNFPTLQYEIALTRLAAGFYRDAADELKETFTIKDGILSTKLGGRFEVEAENFTKLLSLERQASIFQAGSADNGEDAEKLKKLLDFVQSLEAENSDEAGIIRSADEFIKGDDKMKTYRQIYVANQLLDKKKALPKVLEITKDAIAGIDRALEVKNSSSAILADALYEPRRIAISRGEAIIVPEIPSQTLSDIVRGRIEEISGWALYRQQKNDEAIIRLKRAISILPKDSAWLRSSMWRMGTILELKGESKEALNYYIKGYSPEENDEVKRIIIESLYKKINGSLEGLQERLEAKQPETNSTAIFVKKEEPKAVITKQPETKQPERKPESNIILNGKKVPDIVPIARNSEKPKPVQTPAIVNSEMTDEITVTPTPKPEETIVVEKPQTENSSIIKKPQTENTKNEDNDTKTVFDENNDTKNIDTEKTESLVDEKIVDESKNSNIPDVPINSAISEVPTDNQTDLVVAKPETKPDELKNEVKSAEINNDVKSTEIKSDVISDETNSKIKSDDLLTITEDKPFETESQTTKDEQKKSETTNDINAPEIEEPKIEEPKDKPAEEAKTRQKITGKPIVIIEDKLLQTNRETTKTDDTEAKKLDEAIINEVKTDDPVAEVKKIDKAVADKETAEVSNAATKLADKNVDDQVNDLSLEDAVTENLNSETPKNIEINPPADETKKAEDSDVQNEDTDQSLIKDNRPTLIDLGAVRPRIVPADQIKKTQVETPPTCGILVTQEVISIINNGGSMGILVGVEKKFDDFDIKAISSSPEDVDILFEPGIGAEVERAFFVIRSISTNQGEYKVTFETPCGNKEILVKVR